jgi:hypothetical protein
MYRTGRRERLGRKDYVKSFINRFFIFEDGRLRWKTELDLILANILRWGDWGVVTVGPIGLRKDLTSGDIFRSKDDDTSESKENSMYTKTPNLPGDG